MSSSSTLSSTLSLTSQYFTTISRQIVQFFSDNSQDLKSKQTLLGVVLVALGSQLYYSVKYSFWSRRNIKTPPPLPIVGNFLSYVLNQRQKLEVEWPKKYGKVYGVYIGTRPHLVVADVEVFKRVCVRDFDVFPNHYFGVKNKYQKHFLLMQEHDNWRSLRAILTPTFSSGKIKVMHKIIDAEAEDLLHTCHDRIERGDARVVDVKRLISTFSMGAAMRSFYGIQFEGKDRQQTKDEFATKIKAQFGVPLWRFILCSALPDSWLYYLGLPLRPEKSMSYFEVQARKIIERRQQQQPSERQYTDYLQLIIDASAEASVDRLATDINEAHHAIESELTAMKQNGHANGANGTSGAADSFRKKRLTEMEAICQVMMLMLVATETTSTALSHALYLLAEHHEVQEKLYEELMKIAQVEEHEDGSRTRKFDYEQLTSCVYLDCVVSETLRLMPSAVYMDRVASRDYYIEEYNLKVPKGTIVILPFFAIQRDPDCWPEPEKFDPERFAPENKAKIIPGSYCPFGIGPRACIGFRFALTQAKLCLAKMVTEFRFRRAPGSKYPPDSRRASFIGNDNLNLLVSIERRRN